MHIESGLDLEEMLRDELVSSFGIDRDIASDRDLLREGVIDSMGVMELVSYMEERFGILVEDEEIVAENFRSLDALAGFLAGKTGLDHATEYALQVRDLVREATAANAIVLVATSGDDALLAVPDRIVWHFPREPDGAYSGGKPATAAEAVTMVKALREQGAGYIIFPTPEMWWLEYYLELRDYLEAEGRLVVRNERGVGYTLPSADR